MINMVKRSSASVPTPDTGRVVLYVDSTTGLPQAKDSNGTVYVFTGPTGVRGSQWSQGSAAPSASGLAGDMYYRTSTGDVYQNTGGTSWTIVGNITGPQGPAVPLGTSVSTVGTTNAGGNASTASKSDHVHAHGVQTDGTLHAAVTGSVNGFMSSTDKTRFDALTPATTVTDVGAAQAVGSSTLYARQDHVHAHGNQAGGTLHSAVVAGGANGFMLGADKTKLDTLTTANANATTAGYMSAAQYRSITNDAVQRVNVLDFGAVADGSTDNQAAIQAAINSLPASGGIVYFPPGWYNINSGLTVSNSNTLLIGANKGSTLLRSTFATGDILLITGWFCEVQQLQFFTTVNRTSGYAINAGGTNGSTVANYFRAKELLIYGNQGVSSHYNGIRLGDAALSSIDEVELRFWTNYAIHSDGAGDKVINRVVTTNTAANSAVSGIRISACASLLINEVNIINAGNALDIAPGSGVTVPSIKVTNSFFDTSVNGLNMTSAGFFFRSEFTNTWFGSMSNAAVNLQPTTAGGVNGITFVNCDLLNNVGGTTYGIQTNANVGKWRMSSSQIAGWTTGVNLVAGAAHYPSLTNNSIGSIAAFGVNGTGVAIAGGTYKGISFRNNDMADNTLPMNVASGITATDPQLLEISNNPGGMQQGALAILVTPTAALVTATPVLSARIPASAVQPGQMFRIKASAVVNAAAAAALAVSVTNNTTAAAGDTAIAATTSATAVSGNLVTFESIVTVRTIGAATVSSIAGSAYMITGITTPASNAGVTVSTAINTNAAWLITLRTNSTTSLTVNQAVIEAL